MFPWNVCARYYVLLLPDILSLLYLLATQFTHGALTVSHCLVWQEEEAE